MKIGISLMVGVLLIVGIFFYGKFIGYNLAQKEFLEQSQDLVLTTTQENEEIQKKYPSVQNFPHLWEKLCTN